MKKSIVLLLCSIIALFSMSCRQEVDPWQQLFNGEDLSNWDRYLGSSLGADFEELAAAATEDGIFSVVEEGDMKVIRISGEINGSLATRESFENYHLRVVFRWGDQLHSRRNSGLLYHSFGELGVAFDTWMPNIEFQMMHTNLGDTYLMENTTTETPVILNEDDGRFYFTPGADKLTFGEHANGRLVRKSADFELPLGEWNTIELYCFGDTAVHVVNGETVMVNYSTGVYEDGVTSPLVSGKIQIQSEGAELFVKQIEIRPIDGLPEEILP